MGGFFFDFEAVRDAGVTATRRSHIKGLLINCLHHFWPSLLEIPGFLRCFITPIVKATSNSKKGPSKTFFTVSLRRPSMTPSPRHSCPTQVPEYEAWKDSIGSNASKFSVKYYKGLGTSTAAEARDYFSDLATHQLDFDLLREGDGDLVDMAFSKKRVEDRKTWLRSLEPGAFVDYGVDALAYKVSDSASFPNVSELQVASTASSRCRTASTPST